MAGVKPTSGPVRRIPTPEEGKMTRRLGRLLLPLSLVWRREERVPHKLTRKDIEAGLVRFLASVIVVVAIWSGLTLLGIKPIGKSPSAALALAFVFVVGMSIFGLRQELKGKRRHWMAWSNHHGRGPSFSVNHRERADRPLTTGD